LQALEVETGQIGYQILLSIFCSQGILIKAYEYRFHVENEQAHGNEHHGHNKSSTVQINATEFQITSTCCLRYERIQGAIHTNNKCETQKLFTNVAKSNSSQECTAIVVALVKLIAASFIMSEKNQVDNVLATCDAARDDGRQCQVQNDGNFVQKCGVVFLTNI